MNLRQSVKSMVSSMRWIQARMIRSIQTGEKEESMLIRKTIGRFTLAAVLSGLLLGLLALPQQAGFLNQLAAAGAAPAQQETFAVREYELSPEEYEQPEPELEATQQTNDIMIDDGSFELVVGGVEGIPGTQTVWYVNRLQPTSYPSTLSQIRIFFAGGNSNLSVGQPLTLLVGANPDSDTNINGTPFQTMSATIQTVSQFNTYTVPNVTINSGDFVVGFRMTFSSTQFPGALDNTPPRRRRSYVSTNGANFQINDDRDPNIAGNWGIRAVVTTQPGTEALVASFLNSGSGDNGTGDISRVSNLFAGGFVSGSIVTQGILNSEVVVAPNGTYAMAFPTGSDRDSVSIITGLNGPSPVETHVLRTGDVPNAVAISPDSTRAIVFNTFTSPVTYRIITGLPSSPSVSSSFSIPGAGGDDDESGAEDAALTPSGNTVIVSLFRRNEVAIIDGIQSGSRDLRERVDVGDGPNGVAIAPDGNTAFVVNSLDNSISVITGLTPGGNPTVVNTITAGLGASPQAIELTPSGSLALVTNTGSGSVSVFSVSGTNLTPIGTLIVGQAPAGLIISPDGRNALVANAGSRTISVISGLDTFSPFVSSTIGPDSRLDTGAFAEQSVAFVAAAPPPPPLAILNVTPTALTFNPVVGQGNPPSQTIAVQNLGSGQMNFSISSSDANLVFTQPTGGTVSGSQSTLIQVFVNNPNVVGTRTATLTVTAPGAQNSPRFVQITVNTTSPPAILNVTPLSLTFNTVVGQGNLQPQTVTVQNSGSGQMNFNLSSSDPNLVFTSTTSGTLFGGQSTGVQVFVNNPNVVGTRTAQLTVTAPGAQNSPRFVQVTVNTTSPPAILDVTPTSLTFNAIVGQGNPQPQTVTVQNSGSGQMNFNLSSNDPNLAFTSTTSGTLFGGQSTQVQVFVNNPNVVGTRTAQLTVSAPNAQNSPRTVFITVNTTSPPAILNVTPTSLTFNPVVGQGNPPSQTITVQNSGSGQMSFSITSSDPSLTFTQPTSGTVFSGQSIQVQVFVNNPNIAGQRTAQLTVSAPNAQNSPRFVQVIVNTISPPAILNVSPNSLSFNPIVGQGNPPAQTLTVQNTGSGQMNFTISSSDSNLVFTQPTGGTVFSGQSTQIQVFVNNPNVVGQRTATLTVNAPSAQNSPQFVQVTVNTTSAPAILSVSPTTLTFNTAVGQGDPPPQTLTVQNLGSGQMNFTIRSSISTDPVRTQPTGGTLFGGQSIPVQVFVTNPNTPGTRTVTLIVDAPSAQNSPQFVTVIINTTGVSDPNEPNDSPQQATFLATPAQGQSTSITGNATPDDPGTTVNQLAEECELNKGFVDGRIQDWFRFTVPQRGSFQVTLSFSGANIDYDLWWFRESSDFSNFPQSVQLFAFSAGVAGQQEMTGTPVLEPGTYYFGVSRFRRNDGSDAQRVTYTLTLRRGLSPETHLVEDVACAGFLGPENNVNGIFVVNRIRPTQYPARLESITALFFAHPGRPSPNGRPVRVIAFIDPAGLGSPPTSPFLTVNRTMIINVPADGRGQFNTLTLGASGPVISSGDFYVGYVVDTSNGIFPDAGRVLFPGIRSFFSSNGGITYQTFDIQDPGSGRLFNVAIRASVNTAPFSNAPLMLEGSEDEAIKENVPIIRPKMILDGPFD
jgi:hypothetical protein